MKALLIIPMLLLAGCAGNSYKPASAYSPPVAPVAGPKALPDYPGWQRVGDWYFRKLSDDMDASTHVRIFTAMQYKPRDGYMAPLNANNLVFGIEVFDGKIAALAPSSDLGRAAWPGCDFDGSMISVDGAKPIQLDTKMHPGICNSLDIDGQALSAMLAGNEAVVRLNSKDGKISLKGFSEVWRKVQASSK
nr:hypothetical protein [uncultured Pseudomonas sp.]